MKTKVLDKCIEKLLAFNVKTISEFIIRNKCQN